MSAAAVVMAPSARIATISVLETLLEPVPDRLGTPLIGCPALVARGKDPYKPGATTHRMLAIGPP